MRILSRFAIVASALGVGCLGALTATPALASPTPTISFYTQGGSTAQWLPQHSAIQLTVPNDSSYAIVVFHHVSSALPPSSDAPSFTAPAYNSGSPRWYIQLSGGSYLFGYPGDAWNVDNCPGVNDGTTFTYAGALLALGTACTSSVSAVYIVADSSQTVPATDVISAIQYNGEPFTTS